MRIFREAKRKLPQSMSRSKIFDVSLIKTFYSPTQENTFWQEYNPYKDRSMGPPSIHDKKLGYNNILRWSTFTNLKFLVQFQITPVKKHISLLDF